jgi:DNA-binding NarL/FixJ family response regulator
MIRILLVDDQAILCQVLQTWLEREADLEIVASAHDSQTAIEQVEILKPDIVLIDIEMPGMDGITATGIICQRFPETKVIVLSGYDSNTYLANAIRAGAKGYLLKNTAAEDLANTIRSVYKGYSQMGPGLFDKIMAHVSSETGSQDDSDQPNEPDPAQLEPELSFLLDRFDAQSLGEFAQRTSAGDSANALCTSLTQYLRHHPTNLSALYLAGVLSHRCQGHTLSAFQYLRFGFKEGIKQGLSSEELLLFYREGSQLKPEDAFTWLTPVESPFNHESGLLFLIEEAKKTFGSESTTYQTLLALQRIRQLRQFSSACLALGSRLDVLQQDFGKVLAR